MEEDARGRTWRRKTLCSLCHEKEKGLGNVGRDDEKSQGRSAEYKGIQRTTRIAKKIKRKCCGGSYSVRPMNNYGMCRKSMNEWMNVTPGWRYEAGTEKENRRLALLIKSRKGQKEVNL